MNTNTNINSAVFNSSMDVSLSTLMGLSLEQQQQQNDQQDGTSKSLTANHDSIDGVGLFQDNGTNKRVNINPTNNDETCSFFVDLNDSAEPSHQDVARRAKFAEKRRKRTEKHAMNYAEGILSRVLQFEAEAEAEASLQAPEDQHVEFVAMINDRSSANSSSTYTGTRRSERHHFAVAFDILSELDEEDE